LNAAQPGDTITLQAGATFNGNFTLPNKTGSGWIIVRSSASDSSLPSPGTRVAAADAANMARILAPYDSTPAVQTAAGAHHYRFIGIEFTSPVYTYNLIQLGWHETDPSQLPHDIIIDRCYIHGDPVKGGRRGVSLNGNSMAVIDSYVSDFKEVGSDSQAVFGFNGFGPFKIVNNYLEAAGENVMFGGALPGIANLVPSDIEFRRNLVSKPLAWKQSQWSVKNSFELKNARRVLVDGNVFEHTWPAAQDGFAIVLTPRSEDGKAPWTTVEDVTFTNNVLRDIANGVNILAIDAPPSQRSNRIVIRNNLFYRVDGTFMQVLQGVQNLSITHNTVIHTGSVVVADGEPANQNFEYVDNISPHNPYGVFGTDYGVGNPALGHYFPGAVFTHNVLAGPWPTQAGATQSMYSNYPGNFFPASLQDVGFVDLAGGNYSLASSSPYKNAASDGKDIGVDFGALNAAQSVVQQVNQ
jgi:hypothetical protein